MTPAAHAPNCDCRQCQLAMVARLEDLRDALVGLSLALSDWQFEVDRMGRLFSLRLGWAGCSIAGCVSRQRVSPRAQLEIACGGCLPVRSP
jgi:hypothetical protein